MILDSIFLYIDSLVHLYFHWFLLALVHFQSRSSINPLVHTCIHMVHSFLLIQEDSNLILVGSSYFENITLIQEINSSFKIVYSIPFINANLHCPYKQLQKNVDFGNVYFLVKCWLFGQQLTKVKNESLRPYFHILILLHPSPSCQRLSHVQVSTKFFMAKFFICHPCFFQT